MKAEIQQLIRKTLREIQEKKITSNDNTNCNKIKAIINRLQQEEKQADPSEHNAYQESLHDWWFLLCQDPYYQTHVFSQKTSEPAFIETLHLLLERDKRVNFKLDVAIKLGMSLLAMHYPVVSSQHTSLITTVKLILETQCSTAKAPSFVSPLIKQLDELLHQKLPNYFELTKLYNALTLENIARHGILCSWEAQEQGFCLTSIDGNRSGRFSCSAINLNPKKPTYGPKTADEILHFVTQDPLTGIFQIPIERDKHFIENNLSENASTDLVKERIHASVVFIFNHPTLHYSLQDTTCWEQRFDKPLTSKTLQAILVPSQWLSLVKEAFPNVPLIIIKNTAIKLEPSRAAKECLPNLLQKNYTLSIPDYVAGIKRYIKQFKPERFFIHITRLALEHDMKNFLLPDSPWGMKRLTTEAKHAIFTRKFSQTTALKRSHSMDLLIAYRSKTTAPKTESEDATLTENSMRRSRSYSNLLS